MDPSPEPPRRRRWPFVIGGVVLLAGAATGAARVLGDDDDPAPPPVTSALPPALEETPQDPDAVELLDLLAEGRAGTWHATYGTTAADGTPQVTLEVWRRGGRLRQDTVTVAGDQTVRTSSFLTDGAGVLCTEQAPDEWVCARTDDQAASGDGFVGSVTDQIGGSDVVPRDDEVGGHRVRCFAIAGETPADACVTGDGVPVRITAGDVTIELLTLDADVPGSTFDPPADPVQE